MLGKNNFSERLRKMEMQSKQERFSIRKLSIGAASVLLGFTFLGVNSQTIKADTVEPTAQNSATVSKADQGQAPEQEATPKKDTAKPDLSTYKGLAKFLRGGDEQVANEDNQTAAKPDQSANSDQTAEPQPDTKPNNAPSNQPESPANSAADGSAENQPEITKPEQKPNETDADIAKPEKASQQITSREDWKQPSTGDQVRKDSDITTTTASEVDVFDYLDLTDALWNEHITTINIAADITFPWGAAGNMVRLNYKPRKLLIKAKDSVPNDPNSNRKKIDFQSRELIQYDDQVHPMDITYQNLDLYGRTWFGVANSNYTPSANISFYNVNYTGSQMLYVGKNTVAHFYGKNNVKTVLNYQALNTKTGNIEAADTQDTGKQQLFEFNKEGGQLIFEKGCDFTGSTYIGNVIEMYGGTDANPNQVIVKSGANVTLNPRSDLQEPGTALGAQNTSVGHGLIIYGTAKVNVQGTLNINTGGHFDTNGNYVMDDYNSKAALDNHRTKAIVLDDSTADFRITNGGVVNVNTNGNVSDSISKSSPANNLIYDGGNLFVGRNSEFNVTGNNMGSYKGTMLLIGNTANLDGGSLNLTVNDGNGALTLVDVKSKNALTVNNPKSLILNAHSNTKANIIGSNEIDITNVRQMLEFGKQSVALPPFHTLKVQKNKSTKNIEVLQMELLNGKTPLSTDMLNVLADSENAELKNVLMAVLNFTDQDQLIDYFKNKLGTTFDTIFPSIIEGALSNVNNPGYNNIHFIPANPSGFLDIGNTKVTTNADGSRTVTGEVLNYDQATDGPESDGPFKSILPGGTAAYVTAKFVSAGSSLDGQTLIDAGVPNPYGQTNTVEGPDWTNTVADDLPTTFTAQVKEVNGKYTFTFNIPKEKVNQLNPGAQVELTPHANFVDYDPATLNLPADDPDKRPVLVDLQKKNFGDAQKDAEGLLHDAYVAAISMVKGSKLSDADQASYLAAIDNAYNAATAQSGAPNYDPATSIYGIDGTNGDDAITELNNRTNKTIDQMFHSSNKSLLDGFTITNHYKDNADLADTIAAANAAIDNASGKEAIGAAEKAGESAITLAANKAAAKQTIEAAVAEAFKNIDETEKGSYVSGINSAKNTALTNIDNAADAAAIETALNNGLQKIVYQEKAAAEKKLKDKVDAIDTNADLTAAEKAAAKKAANTAVSTAKKIIDNIDSQGTTAATVKGKQKTIEDAYHTAFDAIDQAIKDAKLGTAKDHACDVINTASDKARNDLGLDDAAATAITSAQNTALANIDKVTDIDKLTGVLNTGLNDLISQEKATATSLLSDSAAGQKAKKDIANVDAADATEDNVTGKQDTIKLAFDKGQAKDEVTDKGDEVTGHVDQALANATHEDGTPYTDTEKQAIKDHIKDIVTTANNKIDGDTTSADVEKDKNDALNELEALDTALTNNDHSVIDPILDNDSKVIAERKQNAKDVVTAAADKAREDLGVTKGSKKSKQIDDAEKTALGAIDSATNTVGINTALDTGLGEVVTAEKATATSLLSDSAAGQKAKKDIANVDAADATEDNVTGKQDTIKLAFDKGQAKDEVTDKGDEVTGHVDQALANATHEDGTPYTDTEKQAIKDHIKDIVTTANNKIDGDTTSADVEKDKNDALNELEALDTALTNNDHSVIDPILDNDSKVIAERKQNAKDIITAAADKARGDLSLDKGSDAAKTIDDAETAALNDIDSATNTSGIDTALTNGLDTIIDTEATKAKELLGTIAGNANTTIDNNPNLSPDDKSKAHDEVNGTVSTANATIDNVNGQDTTKDNAQDQQDAIKNAYNDGLNDIQSALDGANDLGSVKTKLKQKLQTALESAKKRVRASGLTVADQTEYLDRIDAVAEDANATIDNAVLVDVMNAAKSQAIDKFNHEGAKAELQAYANTCKQTVPDSELDEATRAQINQLLVDGKAIIDTDYDRGQLDSKDDNSYINQDRNSYEQKLLEAYQTYLNQQLHAAATDWLDNDQSDPKYQATHQSELNSIVGKYQYQMAMATDIKKVKQAYDTGIKAIAAYSPADPVEMTTTKPAAIQTINVEWQKDYMKLSTAYPNLTVSQRGDLLQRLFSALSDATNQINNNPGEISQSMIDEIIQTFDDVMAMAESEQG
ncbi:YSIRK-type signal peptide-containing protein [Lactobacillus sp. ESL0681]|uniref:YSIRK-type signal peptide-containing protein n=1 Tax=Lactobacillus sp. ESL0681 TaxID=2983211 RepID=UPI0023F74E96|nr:YSIRK-type signal peptide-containing protein [Lactobacillus sp. ESL0681]WEV40092.1 YSIRK-type signal peptide-containing protein [Lactobacillus sp. ESL0681]